MKMNVAVVFGGVSCEHDISIITALQVIKNINTEKYSVFPIYITKGGKWLTGKKLFSLNYYKQNLEKMLKNATEVAVLPSASTVYKKTKLGLFAWKKIDCALLALHGENGEDGCVPSIFQLANVPCTSCGVLSSALCCDKVNFKYFVKGLGVKTIDFVSVNETDYIKTPQQITEKIEKELGFPVIVKPSKLGSSIGITVCNGPKELMSGLYLGFNLGQQVLVEKFLTQIREINCAVLGAGEDIIVSELEEPVKTSKILSFENKYINSQKNGDMTYIDRKMPPNISADLYDEVVQTSKLLFGQLLCKGVIRLDYIVQNETLYINEINTIPGSMANYLFKTKNIAFDELIDKLINTALRENVMQQQKIKTFKSDVLYNINLDGYAKK